MYHKHRNIYRDIQIVDSLYINCQAPYLLVPWLAVYMVGIISCYIAAFMYFLTVYYEDRVSVDPIVPVLTGLIFHLVWYFIKNIFNNLRKDLRYRCVPLMFHAVDISNRIFLLSTLCFIRGQNFEMSSV